MKSILFKVIILCSIFSKTGYSQEIFGEFVKNESIKTLNFYAFVQTDNFEERYNNPAVLNLGNKYSNLILEFDDLRAQYAEYQVRIIHCDYNWKKSQLTELEFLDGFNQFFINTYEVSQSTKVPYYHYSFKLPNVKLSGNYILQIFEDDLNSEPIIQKRFRVYDQMIGIDGLVKAAQDPVFWRTQQQLNINLDFGKYFISFPQKELKVLIRQNQRESKTIEMKNSGLVKTGSKTYALKYFENENLFKSGNEFRYLDLTSSFKKGMNVSKIQIGKPDYIELTPQFKRSNKAYLNSYDNDGGFIVSNLNGGEVDLNGDYTNVKFVLNQDRLGDGSIPVLNGKFTNWNFETMDFNPNTAMYEKEILMKQGVYDFAFGLQNTSNQSVDEDFYEGNFSDTGNTYEVFIYHKPLGKRSELLIGYQILKNNK